jgi:uncharacterized repeat protein (TIGR03803 family)
MRGRKTSFGTTAVFVIAAATTLLTSAATAAPSGKILYSFQGSKYSDGSYPNGSLIFDQLGNLYGTTEDGGAYKGGTVFELSPGTGGGWTERVLYSFGNGSDGADPMASLTFDSAGNLYGTTYKGGSYGYGTVFELSPASGGLWTESVLHSFGSGTDGRNPEAKLTIDSAGNLYGTTVYGGTYTCGVGPTANCGVVFELSPTEGGWTEAVLHNFGKGCTLRLSECDGANPTAGVTFNSEGYLFGTTLYGGYSEDDCFCGAVYEMRPTPKGTWTEGVISRKVSYPSGDLVFDSAGNLYGISEQYGCGGVENDCGSVFELSPGTRGGWTATTVHGFCGPDVDGADPTSGLIFDSSSGNLYGATGLSCDLTPQTGGTVYQLSPATGSWNFTVLYSFYPGGSDGYNPTAQPVLDSAGNLYGTTFYGGAHRVGTVYEVTP